MNEENKEPSFFQQVSSKTLEYATDPIKMGIVAIIILAIIFITIGYYLGRYHC